MKTMDYLHLNASAVNGVVNSLKSLLADYQIFYANLADCIGIFVDGPSSSCMPSSRSSTTMRLPRSMNWPSGS